MSMPAENVRHIEISGPVSQLPAQQSETSAVLSMIERVARDPSVNMDKMMQLMEWRKEMVADQRRAAFDEAMAAAKAEIPVIIKNREVDFTSAKGRTNYRHEDLAEIARTVTPILGKYGLSYRYRVSSNVNEPIVVTCIVSHKEGHFEETTLLAGRDESGNKNSIQAVGSTLTYLQRMTLKAALGLAASDDDDGRASVGTEETISQDQISELVTLADEVGADKARFCKHLKVDSFAAIPASKFKVAVDALNMKRRA